MIVYRITHDHYADDLSGKGAERYGGRWNNKGIPVIHASEHRSLCLLELLVHTSIYETPKNLALVEIYIPDHYPAFHITTKDLPKSWKSFPYDPFTKDIGDELLKAKQYPIIKVPSAIVEEEHNFLINPRHDQAAGITVHDSQTLDLDTRFRKG